MRINEVMRETGLTKKAIYYYEDEGLIKPAKDPDNNYRNYSEDDVRRLVMINILRRIDVPIKTICSILCQAMPIKEVLKEQLIQTNRRINLLVQNKLIMNELVQKDFNEDDFPIEKLKKINRNLEELTINSDRTGKELERIFPGTLGKSFAVFYGSFLNVPLDSDEKVAAWNELIRTLDDSEHINFPEEIREAVEDLYDHSALPGQNVVVVEEEPAEYKYNTYGADGAVKLHSLQSFMINNIDVFPEIDKFVCMINGNCSK